MQARSHAELTSTLEVASQVFASHRVTINPRYGDALANYQAKVLTVNMSDTHQAAATINHWVSDATRGLVPSIIQRGECSVQPGR